jgi:hypothetical protein
VKLLVIGSVCDEDIYLLDEMCAGLIGLSLKKSNQTKLSLNDAVVVRPLGAVFDMLIWLPTDNAKLTKWPFDLSLLKSSEVYLFGIKKSQGKLEWISQAKKVIECKTWKDIPLLEQGGPRV